MQYLTPIKQCASSLKLPALAIIMALLQACSGGSGGGASDRETGTGTPTPTSFVYSGPVPVNAEIQNFKSSFYDNAVIRCGSCHTRGGVGTTAFVDNDDVNFAWAEAKKVANLLDPSASEVVARVASGHNCWLSSNASCATSMTGYVERWAQGASKSATTVTLLPRAPQALAGLQIIPASYSEAVAQVSFDLTADPELMALLKTNCSACHSGSSATPQSPYFASDNRTIAYAAMSGKIDLANPANSRFVTRVLDGHNCWSDNCGDDAQAIKAAIEHLKAVLPVVSVDPTLVISAAQTLEGDGIIASAGGRFESDVIAKWEFREGEGVLVADTSGVQPEIPLTLLGEYEWFGGWGVNLKNGRVQGAVSGSSKLHERISVAGEYTIETWIAPNNVSQEDAWIVAYAGGPTARNALLTQTLYNYDFYSRSSSNDQGDGGPATSTDDDDTAAASLQHVVLTYDPFNGRKIYVNGADTGVIDEQGPGNLSNWSDAFAIVLGNDFAGGSPWNGVIRMVAIHSGSLTPEQIVQNYDVGVGQKYYMMFSVAEHMDSASGCRVVDGQNAQIDYCYVVFEVSQFDTSSYQFSVPRFVNINPQAASTALNFDLRGIYLGLNGKLIRTGQGYVNINAAINGTRFTIDDAPLQQTGTIVPLENGPENDVFFLAFEEINGVVSSATDSVPGAFSYAYTNNQRPTLGMRTFDEVNQSYSWITGIAKDSPVVSAVTGKTVSQTYNNVRRSLASGADFQTYMASHQMAVTQLAGAYCDALVEDQALRAQVFTDGTPFNFSAAVAGVSDANWSNKVIYPLIDKVFATGLKSQPNHASPGNGLSGRGDVHRVLLTMITDTRDETDPAIELNNDSKPDGLKFCSDSSGSQTSCPAGRTAEVVKAVCTTVLASAPALMK